MELGPLGMALLFSILESETLWSPFRDPHKISPTNIPYLVLEDMGEGS